MSEQKKKSASEVVGGCVGSMGAPFLEAWVIMLVMGGLHQGVTDHVPAAGYWPALCIVIGLNMLASFARKCRHK
ncbi:hypothetical protein J3S85_37800 [Streptomyces lavenduligriseus]|nr:hypothetical protein J3S85_37800 [Streptomyces lavenduligriseus]